MTRSNSLKTFIGIFGLVLLFAFQNCSKVTSGLLIKDNELSLDQQYSLPTPSETTANGEIDIPASPQVGSDQVDPTSPVTASPAPQAPPKNPPSATPSVVKNPPTSSLPPKSGEVVPPKAPTLPIETCALRPEPVGDHASDLSCKSGHSKEHKKQSSAVKPERKDDDDDDDDDDHEESEKNGRGLKFCKEEEHMDTEKFEDNSELGQIIRFCNQKISLATAENLSVDGFHGKIASEVEHVKQVSNLYGSLFLKAASASASINLISKIRASNKFKTDRTIVLCGFKDVSLIENVRGHIILVDSHITELRDHVGRLTLVNSKIDKVDRQGGGLVSVYNPKH